MAIKGKTRHQLFLPDEMSRRLSVMARSQKRARSDMLVEMVDAWMNRRAASDDAAVAIRLDQLQRAVDETRRESFIISYTLFRFLRQQLVQAAMQPQPDEAARALADRAYQIFLDQVAQRMAKGSETTVREPADGGRRSAMNLDGNRRPAETGRGEWP